MIVVTTILLVAYACLIIYYRQSWLQIKSTDTLHLTDKTDTAVSVIISARNEADNITECLRSIVAQSYPAHLFETIVVDDFSTDDTANIISTFSDKNVILISLKEFIGERNLNSYKKKAIEIGISKARGELIVITDADCILPYLWLQTIAAFYKKYDAAFIAAPVAYYNEKKFLGVFQSLDFMTLQGITGASVYKKFHNMCNGANLAYPKKIFYEVEGFKGIDTIASGDDMLLMNKIFKRYPEKVMFLKSANAIVKTQPMRTLKEFFNQRIRWASKADKYNDRKITFVLILVYALNLSLLVEGILAMFFQFHFFLMVVSLFVKTIVELIFLYPVAKFFKKEKLLWWFPVAQPFHILYTILAGWLGKFGSYKWKERKVK
jgi:cellulose synthase/poly-beta-1,6-N-acetylglucosamine synthase-like glycosyltransferase